MHVNTLIDRFAELPNVEWVACADTIPAVPSISQERGTRTANVTRAREVTGIPKLHEDYQEMPDREAFDIVIFCPENARHGEVAEAIASAGALTAAGDGLRADVVRSYQRGLTHRGRGGLHGGMRTR
jgi:hypothetical protein